ncbi:MAG TPA: M1 family metallopeptidase [Aggregatilinea sp.]|uniref:M1 family metallopeptidase n=1 Tax=Aggregatilinea sp. TaxID=2806333 RepID=UPI002C2F9079|nr:M1 family metallopeptidase [Aggregatilinea sp.]HML24250.1 M1 family metallopeptidase [Aggregatilinea sp.]
MTSRRILALMALAGLGLVLLSACGSTGAGASGLPTLPPTITALPPVTPTDIPAPDPIALPAVDWDNIEPFRAAMRPAYAEDIDAFEDANRYYIEASLDFENGISVLRGAERVRYTNHSADTLTEIVFRLYPNLPALGGRMTIYQAEVNGVPVDPVLTERLTALALPLADPLEPGESVEMMLQFSATAERGMNASYGQFGYQDEVFSGPEWYPVLSVYREGSGWWTERPTPTGDAVFSETGLYETYLTVPKDFTVVMSGSEIESFPVDENRTKYHYVSGPMRDSILVASPIFGRLTEMVDDIKVNVYFWPGGESAAEAVMIQATDSVRVFNENFGEYPYAEFDVAETFNFTGIEYPGVVVIANRNWVRGNAFLETTVAHETAHQWWYSIVGNNQVDEPWLDESLTSYSEYVYARNVYNERRAQEQRESDQDYYNFYRGSGAPDLPLDLPVTSYTDNNYAVIIYIKGPLFYAELENLLGREKFLAAVQLYYERNRYRVVEPNDVLSAFEDATGEDLDAIFYQWVGDFPGLDPSVVESAVAEAS